MKRASGRTPGSFAYGSDSTVSMLHAAGSCWCGRKGTLAGTIGGGL
ncbi:hypothetical protein [Megasphaera cerevisiae]|nr:hypothetical protein [Megasphaera cerevisiae]